MNALPILSVIVMTPAGAGLLIALFGRHRAVPRLLAALAGTVCLLGALGVYVTFRVSPGGELFDARQTFTGLVTEESFQ